MVVSIKKWLLFLYLIQWCSTEKMRPAVVTRSGKIIGRYLTSFKGNKYEAYQGIPFALPPVGDKRFKSPEPVEPWSEILLANHVRNPCLQNSGTGVQGSEDCLYLNVFISMENRNITLPTVIWIHGGGFSVGGSLEGEEEYLMDCNIIFVTVQYRLGVLGFLSTGDHVVSGNMGLKDQSMALKWVHENIEFFRGDPNRVTLLGQSAGAASVHYHYLSPMSPGLFQNGISFSGTALDVWAQTMDPREKAIKLGRIMNCSTADTEQMIQCLRTCSADDITRALKKFSSWRSIPDVHFGPVVERTTSDWFINKSPNTIIKSGKVYDVPWITGVVSEEGLLVVAKYADDGSLQEINDNWNNIAPFLLKYSTAPKKECANFSKSIREHYFGKKSISNETFRTLVHLVGDRWFVVDAEKAARAQAKANQSPVWFYKYSYRATDSHTAKSSNKTYNFGVSHGDDIYLVLKNDQIVPTKSTKEMLMQKELIQLLISFAFNGVPNLNVQWPSVDPSELNFRYLHIDGPGEVAAQVSDNLGEKKFWDSIDFN